MTTDIITVSDRYEVHPACTRDGVETGRYAVVAVASGEVVATLDTRDEAVAIARATGNGEG